MPGRIVRRATYVREYHELTSKDGIPFVPAAVAKDLFFSGFYPALHRRVRRVFRSVRTRRPAGSHDHSDRPGAGLLFPVDLCGAVPASTVDGNSERAYGPGAERALVFQAKQCHNCHALGGAGGQCGPELDSVAAQLTTDQLIRQVIQGGGNMPAYGKNLSPRRPPRSWPFLRHFTRRDKRQRVRLPAPLRSGRTNRPPMSSEVHGGLHSWSLPIPVTLSLVAVAFVYLRAWHQSRKALPNLLSGWRLAAFLSGVLSLWAAAASPLATLDHQLLTIHMVQPFSL